MKQWQLLSFSALAGLALAGCGNDNTAATTANLTVTPSLGMVVGAQVEVIDPLANNTVLGSAVTGANGTATVTFTPPSGEPLGVRVSGATNATYYDEALNSSAPFPANQSMHALMGNYTAGAAVGVTAITEAAYQSSIWQNVTMTPANIRAMNEQVRQALAPEVSDIFAPPTLWNSNTTAGALNNTTADLYALRLAALAHQANGTAAPALTIMRQLADDLKDGSLNGTLNGTAIENLTFNAANLSTTLSGHMNTLAGHFGAAGLQQVVGQLPPLNLTIDMNNITRGPLPPPGGGNTTTGNGTLPAGLAGQEVNLTFCCANNNSPITNGTVQKFTFSSSGILALGNDYRNIGTHITRTGNPELIFTDSTNNVEYGVVVLDGHLHEVNVMGVGGTPFYGQYAPANGTGGTTPPGGTDLWTLNVNGTVAFTMPGLGAMSQPVNVTVQNTPVPTTTSVQQAVSTSYTTSGTVTVTEISNTATTKSFRVQFSGTYSTGVQPVTATYDLTYTYTK
ncbi:MAG: hypothetical protein H7831_14355 [Magnetococcus sp. WYHC-3]